ncbi:MAG: lamin tail domain-containing protein, partial [Planctomycetes bacterium]|nr:lamin tail domain-containing protein [Planctomycetota bacterium]
MRYRSSCCDRLSVPSFESLEPRLLLSGQPIISEFMAINDDTVNGLRDSDGELHDWLEIYNPSDQPVDMTGWKLEDSNHVWTFPSMTLDAGAYRVIFCSGKDRRDPAEELHTNFGLSGSGEYLALLDNADNVVHAYDPKYPKQFADISYGIAQKTLLTTFVAAGDIARYLVPTEAPGDWTAVDYNDADWQQGRTGIGFADLVDGFAVWNYDVNTSIGNISTAKDIIANNSPNFSENAPVINYLNSGGSGHFTAGETDFPGFTTAMDTFVIEAKAYVDIPQAGDWSFGVNSDDGFSLDISDGQDSFHMEYPNPRGAKDTIQTFHFDQAGKYDLDLVYFEAGGSAELELFASPGAYTSFS